MKKYLLLALLAVTAVAYAADGTFQTLRKTSTTRLTAIFSGGESVAIPATLQDTVAATFTANGTGGGTSSSVTMRVSRTGDWVSLYIPAFNAASGSGSPDRYTASVALPTWAKSTGDLIAYGGISRNNGASSGEIARVVIQGTGVVLVFRNSQGSIFTASTSGGVQNAIHVTYYVGTGS